MADIPPDAPAPRMCRIVKWSHYEGYGFNLRADKSKPGQYIGKVDPGSPAEAAGLKAGDRIVEVNDINIANENHRQVVERVKQFPDEAKLLVVDTATDEYYKARKIVVKGTQNNVLLLSTPETPGSVNHEIRELPDDAPIVRLCHLVKWADFDGYGFNLQYEKEKQAEFIGSVESDSPADMAGLVNGDRIVEVNGECVENLPHAQVVDKIRAIPHETKLLVVDRDTDSFYHSRGIPIDGSMRVIKYIKTPVPRPRPGQVNGSFSAETGEVHVEGGDAPSAPESLQSEESEPTKVEAVTAAIADLAVSTLPAPRLCHIRKWLDFEGYGFNLQYDKSSSQEFIGDVDHDSPADMGGLRKGDRVIEVNGDNVEGLPHMDVVNKIKSNPSETKMLVVSSDVYEQYRARGIPISSALDNIEYIATPVPRPRENGDADGIVVQAVVNEIEKEPEASEEDTPPIRHCTIRKWPKYSGYGFTLQYKKDQNQEYIGNVEADGPADAGGLLAGDRVVEVNETNVEGLSHEEVVDNIKSNPNRVTFLVVDSEAFKFFQSRNMPITARLKVTRLETPEEQPDTVIPTSAPWIRECLVRKWPDFSGYGFTLRYIKDKKFEMVNKVTPDSPADLAGLLENDQVVEVNGKNIVGAEHADVIELVKSIEDHVTLLVLGKEAVSYYSARKINVSSELPNVRRLETPENQPGKVQVYTGVKPPRECVIHRWPDYKGYGFALRFNKLEKQEYVHTVAAGGPADAGGLQVDDVVVEINGKNISGWSHDSVIEAINKHPSRVLFLVVDDKASRYYKSKSISVNSQMKDVIRLETPTTKPIEGPAPSARLCTIRKVPNYEGYGFNLQYDKDKKYELIRNVESGSPAESGGLQTGDRVIEVNWQNVEDKSHNDIVGIIKSNSNHVVFLVADLKTVAYYASRGVAITSSMENIEKLETPLVEQEGPAPSARLCTIRKVPNYEGYGFNLQYDKDKKYELIRNVESGSPAESGGLQTGDRVIEVNWQNVEDKSHNDIVGIIKSNSDHVVFLVADLKTVAYYASRGVAITSSMENIEKLETPLVEQEGPAPSARLCTIRKVPNYEGYGFNLQYDKDKKYELIRNVESGSPAESGGLQTGDRVIEVNWQNVEDKSHNDIVGIIKSNSDHVVFLVADLKTVAYYASRGVAITSSMENIEKLETPLVEQEGPAPSARLCTIRKVPDYEGYGFNLHYDKDKLYELIRNVESGSPAESGGLQSGDRVIEVNWQNVEDKSHGDIVNIIKSNDNEVIFLVADLKTVAYYASRGVAITSSMDNVEKLETPVVAQIPEQAPTHSVRQCTIRKWPDYEGYGFNLFYDKNKKFESIRNVEPRSPAEAGGLRSDDRVIEVNGRNVEEESHTEIVALIRSHSDYVVFLVADAKTIAHYKARRITIKSGMENIEKLETPVREAEGPAPSARLCTIRKLPNYEGYGFNLQYDKDKKFELIRSVESGSPAESGGLQSGDRVIEVNWQNVEDKSHSDIVGIIKSNTDHVVFLVADLKTVAYYTSRGVAITSSMDNIEKLETPLIKEKVAERVEEVLNDAPEIRLCTIHKWPDYEGYGFNLKYDRVKEQEFIGDIEADSPAETGGLRTNDRVVEVNGQNIEDKGHKEVIDVIKTVAGRATFLVVDPEADEFYASRGITVTTNLPNIKRIETPESRPARVAEQIIEAVKEIAEDAPKPRLCTIHKWADYDGYGFTLEYDESGDQETVTQIQEDGPAHSAGLLDEDRIVEVNGTNISGLSHLEVIKLIRTDDAMVALLVVDEKAESYYSAAGIVVTSKQKNVENLETVVPRPGTAEPERKVVSVISEIAEGAPKPRKCTIRMWHNYEGYGFNLKYDKTKQAEYIEKVESESPAYAGGLRVGDRIVEVNDDNIDGKSHLDIVKAIKANASEVVFLVVDAEADEYYSSRNIKVTSQLRNVELLEAPVPVTNILPAEEAVNVPRLCKIHKWPDFEGYGFCLVYNRAQSIDMIGRVDAYSPAEAGGLAQGDFIIEVNGVNVEKRSCEEIETYIKQSPTSVTFLVADEDTYLTYKSQRIPLTSRLHGIQVFETPLLRPASAIVPANEYNEEQLIEDRAPETLAPREANIPSDAPQPRYCHVCKWPDFPGFGFSLVADKAGRGEFMGDIDADSPADFAGLKRGDRIIEVNKENVEHCTHSQVVEKIKAISDETKLLVVDEATDSYYNSRDIKVSKDLGNIQYIKTPVPRPGSRLIGEPEVERNDQTTVSAPPPAATAPAATPPPAAAPQADGDVFQLSAQQLRAQLTSKKRRDPRLNPNMDIKQKYEMLNKL